MKNPKKCFDSKVYVEGLPERYAIIDDGQIVFVTPAFEASMKSKHPHCPETHTYPADKMIEKAVLKPLSAGSRKVLKKVHVKRSRRHLKNELSNQEEE